MKSRRTTILVIALTFLVSACATMQDDRYNTQKGAAVGAGIGALLGQALGKDTGGTLLGAGIGTLIGAIAGNAVDQEYQATKAAAQTNKRVVYVDDHGGAVEAIPKPMNREQQETNCRKVTKRVWNKGEIVSETIEEICEGEKTSRDY